MSYAKILLDIRDGIATITLNRPEAYNALDMQLATELHDAVVTCKRGCGSAGRRGHRQRASLLRWGRREGF